MKRKEMNLYRRILGWQVGVARKSSWDYPMID